MCIFLIAVAVERLKVISESPTSWDPLYTSSDTDSDQLIPECAEKLMQLIAGITGQWRLLQRILWPVSLLSHLSPILSFPFLFLPFPIYLFSSSLLVLFFSPLERFRRVPSLYIRLQFLQLQVDLLLEFQRDLVESVSKSTTLSESFSAYLNASHYIVSLLQKWGEETVSDNNKIILFLGGGGFTKKRAQF